MLKWEPSIVCHCHISALFYCVGNPWQLLIKIQIEIKHKNVGCGIVPSQFPKYSKHLNCRTNHFNRTNWNKVNLIVVNAKLFQMHSYAVICNVWLRREIHPIKAHWLFGHFKLYKINVNIAKLTGNGLLPSKRHNEKLEFFFYPLSKMRYVWLSVEITESYFPYMKNNHSFRLKYTYSYKAFALAGLQVLKPQQTICISIITNCFESNRAE